MMWALSIRQPWAWLIVRPDITDPSERQELAEKHYLKDLECRSWETDIRGQIFIHASRGGTRQDFDAARLFALKCGVKQMPAFEQLDRGGIVGVAHLRDCILKPESRWFMPKYGPYGFVLKESEPRPFFPCLGQLGFFRAEVAPIAGKELHVDSLAASGYFFCKHCQRIDRSPEQEERDGSFFDRCSHCGHGPLSWNPPAIERRVA